VGTTKSLTERIAIACGFGRSTISSRKPDDLLQERLYCVQWISKKKSGKGDDYEFRDP
jgi:hypothetical protein